MPSTYTTVAEMTSRLGERLQQILNVADGADVSANATLLAAIASANGSVDSFLRTRYDLPLTTTPDQLIDAASAIATYNMVARRPEIATEADVEFKNDAMRYLRDIASGKASIDIGDDADATSIAQSASVRLGSTAESGGRSIFDQSWRTSY